ncbi:tetratricopeptide repeat protein [Clostridium sp.]|uniref:tetratricopeptide repeat protein n=1 Tax=Clostridium sp. TaxID=1506 RepID=UPI003D6D5539
MENSINLDNDEILVREYIERGKGLFNDGETEKAFKEFNKAILINNEYAETYLVKAQALIGMCEAYDAEKCINKYIELAPYDPKGYWKLIEIHDLTGDFDRCIYYCEKLLELQGENITIYLKKAEFLGLLNDFEKALDCFNICLKLCPDFYDALCGKASSLRSLGKKKEALEVYNKAIEVDSTKSVAYYGKSEIYVDMNKIISALIYAEKAYRIDPKNEWYKCHYTILKNINIDTNTSPSILK